MRETPFLGSDPKPGAGRAWIGALGVTGGSTTDSEFRASWVRIRSFGVAGTLTTNAKLRASWVRVRTLGVTGPFTTDSELRASWAGSGPLAWPEPSPRT